MKVIVGLGNPGKEYSNTRHNIGFMIVDNYVGDVKWTKKFDALIYEVNYDNDKVLFVKPQTFMNLSGNAVAQVAKFYKLNPEDFLIIHDDLDLEVGTIRFKTNSSSGGHNGIKSIISSLGSQSFNQLKIGIGSSNSDIIDYVIGNFSKKEIEIIKENKFIEMLDFYLLNGIEKSMSFYNKK